MQVIKQKGADNMTIGHLKMRIRQDADLDAVKNIVLRHSEAFLDVDAYIVYYNSDLRNVEALKRELLRFEYDAEVTIEEF